jgi:hypothetical protein
LELEPNAAASLDYQAGSAGWWFGLGGSSYSGSVAQAARVDLTFASPVSQIRISGSAWLYGVRVVSSPAGTKPSDLVKQTVVLHSVTYQATNPPPAPPFLGTTHLQTAPVAGDPNLTTQDPPRSIGFRMFWLPPSVSGPVPWPPDIPSFPPFDEMGFNLERRRVDTGGSFEDIDGSRPPTLLFGNRGSKPDTPQLYPGIDILGVFPESPQPVPPISPLMQIDDVLVNPNVNKAPFGSLHQYRMFSVDAIGRRSAIPTIGSIVRLEKHTPPPVPVGPTTAVPANSLAQAGVRARVLLARDPDLTADDIMLLRTNKNAIVLEWGWTAVERDKDSTTREFRVYFQPQPADLVQGQFTGTATRTGTLFTMTAQVNHDLGADAMKGFYVLAGGYPFQVATHPAATAGVPFTVSLLASLIDPGQVPAAGDFDFHPMLDGSELRPASWAERTAVVPITAAENYQYVFRDRLTIDTAHPSVYVWVGVSAADDQTYVADEIPSASANGGRGGNESSVAAASAQARYRGRPVFTVPPPLPNVPEEVTDEPVNETVGVSLDLPVLLPVVNIPPGHRIVLERVCIDALIPLLGQGPGGTIGVLLPDGSTSSYTLANPGDQSAFLAEIAAAVPGAIEGRFLVDFYLRYASPLETLWQRAFPQPVDFGALEDTLPDKAARYLHRIRLVDPVGNISTGWALLPQIVRVVSLRVPTPPKYQLSPAVPTVPGSDVGDRLVIDAQVYDAFDLKWVLVFTLAVDITTPLDPHLLSHAQLLRLPNRRDLYPNQGIALRLRDGTLLAPSTAVDIGTGTSQIPNRLLKIPIQPGYGKQVATWVTAVTRDGIPSRYVGARVLATAPPPLVVPVMVVHTVATSDQATWGALPAGSEAILQRTVDGGTTWQPASPWLPETSLSFAAPAPGGARLYRLVLRSPMGRSAVGTTVAPS